MAQRGTWLACQTCGLAFELTQAVRELPDCANCGPTVWRTMEPLPAIEWTERDRRFLKQTRIAAD